MLEAPRTIVSRPATATEVEAALHRIFGKNVTGQTQTGFFTTGDFNGDGSSDLAVLVRPNRAMIDSVNDPLSNWIVQDARQAFFPPPDQRVVFRTKNSRPTIRMREPLLAVIHGYGADGWRDSQARQAYLVRNPGTGPLRAIPAAGHIKDAPISIMHSEIIYEDSPPAGFLFWTGAQYAWRALSDETLAKTRTSD